jgi:hypothetical protein
VSTDSVHPAEQADVVACGLCGTVASSGEAALTWTMSVEGVGASAATRHYCPACSRENVRAIESKLDAAWW